MLEISLAPKRILPHSQIRIWPIDNNKAIWYILNVEDTIR